ncbi:PH domain-containing protein [Williamsia soli]|uniref:PH domain-containing protein n=1 Tax=Williamsia soli TaxID=364929 RepID=UPI001F30B04D|nr:PH domain-containing protein [Williamsia soli]
MITTYEGMNCIVVLDTDSQTLTLTHSGMTTPKHKKESSPWVIPLGAIESIEWKEKSAVARGYMRPLLVNRVGWAKTQLEDVNAFFAGKQKLGEFVKQVEGARSFSASVGDFDAAPAESTAQRLQKRTDELQRRSDELKGRSDVQRSARQTLRPDVQAAKDRMQGTFGTSREFKNLESHLWEGETVEMACGGQYGNGQGILVLTNTRLLFTFHGITSQTNEDFPFSKISSIQWSAGMLMGTVTIFASGNKAEINNVSKSDGKPIVDRVRGIISGQFEPERAGAARTAPLAVPHAAPPAPTPPPPPPSVPAGWYPDSSNALIQRYWDGAQWTEHTAPRAPQ